MGAEKAQDAQELNEQELSQVSGAGGQGGFTCKCGNTEYTTIKRNGPKGSGIMISYRKCTKCGREEVGQGGLVF